MKAGRVGSYERSSVTIVHYYPYVSRAVLDKEGNPRKRRDGTVIKELQRLMDNPAEGEVVVPARKMRWDFSKTVRSQILDLTEAIARGCTHCGSKDSITWEAIVCGNPNCEFPILDKSSAPAGMLGLLENKKDEVMSRPYTCEHCGETHVPVMYSSCSNCSSASPATLFDVEFSLYTTGEGRSRTLNIAWSAPHPIVVPKGMPEEDAKELFTPFELQKILGPHSIEDQKRILGELPDSNTSARVY